jgi:signal transduction histidine kinase
MNGASSHSGAVIPVDVSRLHAALSGLTGGVLLVSEERRVEFVNQGFCEIFAIREPAHTLIGISASEMMVVIGRAYAQPAEALARVAEIVERGEPVHAEEVQVAGGRTVLRDFVPLYIGDVRYGRLWYHQDITSLKRMEAEQLAMRERLQQAQRAESLGRMAGAIAHHFNNRLAVVMGNIERALDFAQPGSVAHAALSDALTAARQSADISGMMRTYLGQSTEAAVAVDLAAACRRQVDTMSAARPGGVTLTLDVPEQGPIVRATPTQLQQLIAHLVTNAWESMEGRDGTVTVAARVVQSDDLHAERLDPPGWLPREPAYACLEVTDSGTGVEPGAMDLLFEPFFTTKLTGRGLGLPVILGMLKAWGGAIGVQTMLSRGSTFRVFLPLAAKDAVPVGLPAGEPGAYVPGGTVLLVEDEDMVRAVAASMLQRLGFQVVSAADGREALRRFREDADSFRCVVTDVTMSGMGGWQTLEALRKIVPELPVVLTSGFDECEVMRSRGFSTGPAPAFLHKPFSKAELGRALARVLSRT